MRRLAKQLSTAVFLAFAATTLGAQSDTGVGDTDPRDFEPTSDECVYMFESFEGPLYNTKTPRAIAMSPDGQACGWCIPGSTCSIDANPADEALRVCEESVQASSDDCRVVQCVGC